jgi:hypothetical protein
MLKLRSKSGSFTKPTLVSPLKFFRYVSALSLHRFWLVIVYRALRTVAVGYCDA